MVDRQIFRLTRILLYRQYCGHAASRLPHGPRHHAREFCGAGSGQHVFRFPLGQGNKIPEAEAPIGYRGCHEWQSHGAGLSHWARRHVMTHHHHHHCRDTPGHSTRAKLAADPSAMMTPVHIQRSGPIGVNPICRRIYSVNADSKKRQFLGCATKRELTLVVEVSSSSWYCCARSAQAAVLSESTHNAGDDKRRHARASFRVASVLGVRGASALSECPEYAGALAPSHSVRDRAGYERRATAWPGRVCSRSVGPNLSRLSGYAAGRACAQQFPTDKLPRRVRNRPAGFFGDT